ncbi:MAG: HAMP domain-containing histidine kinase, partial [Saprospiraceae bacterium]|nr:HAMP domain-containing histidine kinase [Saprospiraceae bacterium]
VKEVASGPASEVIFSDTVAMHPHLNQMEVMRRLSVVKGIAGKFIKIVMIDVFVEESDIYESVIKIITRLFVLLALALLIAGFFMSKILFRPFNETLEQIRDFKVQSSRKIELPRTSTKEFATLNAFIGDMTDQAQSEYQALKKFSEDASHEIQTPLAIAQGKLELLTNDPNLSAQQFALIESAQKALKRLSKVQQSLALLTRIENREFDAQHNTDVSLLLENTMQNFKELFEMRDLSVQTNIDPDVVVKLDAHLGAILLDNLVHNAIRHNVDSGHIVVNLDKKQLSIHNSGAPPVHDPERMFRRFEKNGSMESTGLGLALAKEICDYHSMEIRYIYHTDHEIKVIF